MLDTDKDGEVSAQEDREITRAHLVDRLLGVPAQTQGGEPIVPSLLTLDYQPADILPLAKLTTTFVQEILTDSATIVG